METVNIEKIKLDKLVELFNKVKKSPHLTKGQIKELRTLIKSKGESEKRRYFPFLNSLSFSKGGWINT